VAARWFAVVVRARRRRAVALRRWMLRRRVIEEWFYHSRGCGVIISQRYDIKTRLDVDDAGCTVRLVLRYWCWYTILAPVH
jgi:hypothetical protein